MKPASAAGVAEYLANREGLTGTARLRFLRAVAAFLGRPQSNRFPWVFAGLLLLLSAGGLFLVPSLWPLMLPAALVLGCLLLRPLLPYRPADLHAEWRVYCILLRPVILSRHPGLLDRNLAADQSHAESLHPAPTWWAHLRRSRDDFRQGGVVGIWLGTAVLLCWFRSTGDVPPIWSFAILGAGFLLGTAAWSFSSWFVFRVFYRQAAALR